MKIITLTLNPAFDIHCLADGFKPYSESVVSIIARDAGGKGVNISRALSGVGTVNTAIVVLGEENGEEFYKLLLDDGMSVKPIYSNGRIRENITLHERVNPETRLSFGGFSVENSIISKVNSAIGEVDENTIITFTGSIPRGMEIKDVLKMLLEYKALGAKVVIDSRSVTLGDIIDFKPWLIKPNKDEAEKYIKKDISTFEDALKIASEIHKSGVENVMISLGGDGAVLVSDEGCYYAKTPKIRAVSTIGAGDSAIAGFIDGFSKGYKLDECLCYASAFGTAACMRNGTKPPLSEDIQKIKKEIKISKASV